MAVLGAGGGSGGGAGVSSVDATASGAITSGKPVFLKGDGTIAQAAGTGSSHALDDSLVCDTYNNSNQNSCYNARTFIDRAAGRGILLHCGSSTYNYQGRYKLFTVNATTGQGSGQNQYSVSTYTNIPVESNYCQFPAGAVWDNNGYWIAMHRRNSSGSQGLVATKIKTSNGYSMTAHYGHNLGNSGVFSTFSIYTGQTALVKDTDNNRNYLVMAPGNITGGAGIIVYGPLTWTSDANDGLSVGTGASSGQVTAAYMYGSIAACYDSANNQIIAVHSGGGTGTTNYRLLAFDLNQDTGVPSYSHISGSTRTSSAISGKVECVAADNSGNICWGENDEQKIYSAKNTGSAFTYGGELDGPGTALYLPAMDYVDVADQWAAVWTSASSGSTVPTVQQFSVANGVIGSKTKVLTGAGTQYAGSNGYAGTYTNRSYQGGPMQPINDKGYVFQFGIPGSPANTSSVNSVFLGLSNTFTSDYIGLAEAAINNGASGTITTKGAINTAQSGLTAGARFFVTPTGTVKQEGDLTATERSGAVFMGTATNATSILVGDSLKVTDGSAVHNDVPKTLTSSGFVTQVISYPWYSTIQKNVNYVTVSASGSSTIFEVQGTGTVLYFIMSAAATSSTNTNVDVFFDGIQVANTGTVSTEDHRSLSIIGDFHGRLNGQGHGNYLTTSTAHNFNSSFEVRRNTASVATSFWIAYKIVET